MHNRRKNKTNKAELGAETTSTRSKWGRANGTNLSACLILWQYLVYFREKLSALIIESKSLTDLQ
jgi:hypothetical protein